MNARGVPVGIPVHNCLGYTKQAVTSLRHADGVGQIVICDNASTDGTKEWAKARLGGELFGYLQAPENRGVAWAWNEILEVFFEQGHLAVAIFNNDVIVAQDCLVRLEQWQREGYGFVTVYATASPVGQLATAPRRHLRSEPDFFGFLISRVCWDKVGQFDEQFWPAYFEDKDYLLRMEAAGIQATGAMDALVVHAGSRTIHEGGLDLREAYEKNRLRFEEKWGRRAEIS